MSVTQRILSRQLECGVFDSEENMVSGIARRAVDPAHGYDSLSPAQKRVLDPFLTQPCSGYTNPGGEHNECAQVLSGDELLDAYNLSEDTESLECESCRSERGYAQHVWEKNYVDK